MTFDEWWADKREKHLSTWYRYPEGSALAAWNASAARYAPLVEACEAACFDEKVDRAGALELVYKALAAVKEEA